MKWITAVDLERWADTLDSRIQLSQLVSNLVRASASKIADFRFPTGDSAQLPGYDGRLIAEAAPPYVPGGESVWEFGTDKDYLKKANADYATRTKSPGAVDPGKNTFVFITPRRWSRAKPSIESWCKTKIDDGRWKDVRVIDASGLESWLYDNPAAAAQAARELPGLGAFPKDGARSALEFWTDYAYRFKPTLTEEVVLCGRDKQAEELLQQLGGFPQPHIWQADSPEEAVAFAIATIRSASNDLRKFFESRTMVVDSRSAARLLSARKNMIFIPRDEALELAGPLARNNVCIVGIGRESRRTAATVLQRPNSHDLAEALKSTGLDENKAHQLARTCGRSVTILGRLIPSATARRPAWAENATLIPAVLAGSWNMSNEHDQDILRALAGVPTYVEYEDLLRPFLTVEDSPVEIEGQVWNVRAPVDAFAWLASSIGKQHLDRLQQVFQVVFSEQDPSLDLSAAERPYAGLTGKNLKHSAWLRDGLATTLLLISVFHQEAGLTAVPNPEYFVEKIIANLPGLKDNERLIASMQGELPVLMEAAPRPLLKALEHLLGGDGSSIRPIFSDTDPLFSHSPHTGLLWALELAAWDPGQLARVATLLAKLARIDPGGRLSNRPINSLSEILVPWHPNTNATLVQRLAALDQVIAKESEIGWRLTLTLLPGGHDISHTTMKPRYREAGASEQEILTHGLVWETYRQVIKRALDHVGSSVERWASLISKLDRFDSASRDIALRQLDALAPQLTETDRTKLWSTLRDLVNRHRAFQDAAWAMKPEELEKLERIVHQFQPSDIISRVAWLFNDYHPRLPEPDTRADYTAVDTAREEAIRQVYAAGGHQRVLFLAHQVTFPRFVAFAAAAVIEELTVFETLIEETLGKDDRLDDFAVILSARALAKFKTDWPARISAMAAAKRQSTGNLAKLTFAWPDEPATWTFVSSFGAEIEAAYWTGKQVGAIEKDKDVVEFAVRKYLSVGRGVAAVEAISWALELASSELILEALDKSVDELNVHGPGPNNTLIFEFERVFDALGQRHDVAPVEIAKREYQYLPLLETHLMENKSKSLVLHRIMAEDPPSFVMILCDVFKPASGEPREPNDEARRRANVGYRLLDSFHSVPGQKNGDIDASELRKWVQKVRQLAKEKDRERIADEYIGHLLAYAPGCSDGFWPHIAVRDLLEEVQSEQVEIGIQIERSNMRGVVTKAMYEGGSQERSLAQHAWASAKATEKWPRTSKIWRQLAEGLEYEAKREDERARQDEMWYE